MSNPVYDIIILGGGCTALSFAMQFTQSRLNKKILILEARNHYQHDRNWSFWLHKENKTFQHRDIIKKTWSAWRFSYGDDQIQHEADNYFYATIASGDFYDKAQKLLQEDTRIRLCLSNSVQAVERGPGADTFSVTTSKETFLGRTVIDTRSIAHTKIKSSGSFYQIFYGYEIKAEEDIFDTGYFGLMEEMISNNDQLSFLYILPFSKTQALVELTLFTKYYTQPENLENKLKHAIQSKYPDIAYNITDREQATLIMGKMNAVMCSKQNNYLRVGSHQGALRESSGYAFLNIQNWAYQALKALTDGKSLPNSMPHNLILTFLDRHFIKTLKAYPDYSADIFMDIAKNVRADAFARFMIGECTAHDLLCMINAVPKKIFMRVLWS